MADSKANAQLCVPEDASMLTTEEGNVHHHNHQHLSILSTSAPSPSLSFSSSSPENELAVAVSSKKIEDVNDEEGYHTPTSPRHRIPPPVECPPAPKKPVGGSRRRKRKAAWIGMPRFWIDTDDHLEFMNRWSMRKKARREEESHESY